MNEKKCSYWTPVNGKKIIITIKLPHYGYHITDREFFLSTFSTYLFFSIYHHHHLSKKVNSKRTLWRRIISISCNIQHTTYIHHTTHTVIFRQVSTFYSTSILINRDYLFLYPFIIQDKYIVIDKLVYFTCNWIHQVSI